MPRTEGLDQTRKKERFARLHLDYEPFRSFSNFSSGLIFHVIICVILLTALAYIEWIAKYGCFAFVGFDDANILFTYAKHLAKGYGIVYNLNGTPVEGATSLLWTVITAVAYLLHSKSFPLILAAISVSTLGLALGLSMYTLRLYGFRPFTQYVIFLLPLSIAPGFIDWTVLSGLETGIYIATILAATALLLLDDLLEYARARRNALITCSVFLPLIRPEGFAFGLVIASYLTIRNSHLNTGGPARIFMPLGVFFGTIASLTVFRLLYFGWPLPNTFYAKVPGDLLVRISDAITYYGEFALRGSIYFVVTFGAFFVVIFWVVYIVAKGLSIETTSAAGYMRAIASNVIQNLGKFTVVSIFFGQLLLVIYVGGDNFPYFRRFHPAIVVALLVTPIFLRTLLDREAWLPSTRKGFGIFVFTVLFVPIATSPGVPFVPAVGHIKGLSSPLERSIELAVNGRKYGAKMWNELGAKDLSVGVTAAGGFAYSYRNKVIDLLGLNNQEIAHAEDHQWDRGVVGHRAFSRTLFFKIRPDILLFRNKYIGGGVEKYKVPDCHNGKASWKRSHFSDLICLDKFREYYTFVRYEKGDYTDVFFVRRDVLRNFDKGSFLRLGDW